MEWNRVWAIGRETYFRFYPNPGFGIQLSEKKRFALSLRGGFELFDKHREDWRRTWSFLSRVKRPQGR